ncbi:transketolase C-terminal domain-containing protein [Salmonella enterica]|uniref:transketolase family protein n=1 Tax=Salmonella enterica TaxID=28901 RepID=UPI0026DD82C0|nr:transketolase C-terminal domain-containing protein [Salmonella enterica]MDO3948475.1 transketolase C-terminal domain-containing protein [Salmonella enterica]
MIKLAPAGLKDDIEMRKVYAGFVAGQIEAGSPIIALEADLMSSMAMDSVARDYPQHVINCGIMEANVIGTAAGLAHSVVLEVTDAVMFADILRQLMDLDGFYWLRTIRKQARSIYAPGSTFTIGKGNVLREGDDITLIANGIMVAEALEAARQLEQEGVSAAVIDMFTLKPIDRMLVKNYAEKTRRIVTCENHSIHNGLGSAVAEVLVENCPVPMRRVGVKERYGQVGTQDFLQQEYGLTAEAIVEAAKSLL